MITSGSVFVFDEEESGIKRWTDGFFWSPSRILGNFLLYRETDKNSRVSGRKTKAAGRGGGGRGQGQDDGMDGEGGGEMRGLHSLSRPKGGCAPSLGGERSNERKLIGSLNDNSKFKQDGLMKKVRPHPPLAPSYPHPHPH